MPPDFAQEQPRPANVSRGRILSVVLAYAAFAALWILVSDKAVEWLFTDRAAAALANTLKGWSFVLVTSLLLYALMRRLLGATAAPPDPPASLRAMTLPLVLAAVTIGGLTALGIGHGIAHQKAMEVARLQSIAQLKANLIEQWLRARQANALHLRSSKFLAARYLAWHRHGDAAALTSLRQRLDEIGNNFGYLEVLLLDARGAPPAALPPPNSAVDAALAAAARQAIAAGAVVVHGPHRAADGKVYIDFIVALGEAPAAVVLRVEPVSAIDPLLQNWPVPSASGETLLFQRDGEDVLFLNQLRHRADAAADHRLPLATEQLPEAQVLRGEIQPGGLVEGVDYRNVPVLGVAQAIAGTRWFLVAKVDRREVYEEAARGALWIALTGLLALFVAATGAFVYRQRQQLLVAEVERAAQAEKLRALQLLDAIAESSSDAIFAKDAAGRYLLFNREAARVTGKEAAAVLGRDDSALFPPQQAARIMDNDRQAMAQGRAITFQETLSTADGEIVFLATKGPLRDAAGQVVGMFGISRDITERERAAAALRASEATYRSLFENTLNSVVHARVIFQADTPVDLEYITANPAFAAVSGITAAVAGRRISAVIPGYCEHNRESLEVFGRVARGGVPTRWEHHLRELERWFSFMIYSPAHGEVVIVSENITARKNAEDALRRRNEELERFNRATVGRELDMIELKRQVNALARELGRAPPHALAFLDPPARPTPGDPAP